MAHQRISEAGLRIRVELTRIRPSRKKPGSDPRKTPDPVPNVRLIMFTFLFFLTTIKSISLFNIYKFNINPWCLDRIRIQIRNPAIGSLSLVHPSYLSIRNLHISLIRLESLCTYYKPCLLICYFALIGWLLIEKLYSTLFLVHLRFL